MSTSGPEDDARESDDRHRRTAPPPPPGATEGLGSVPGTAEGAASQVGAAAAGVGPVGSGVGSAASVGAGTGAPGSAAGVAGAGSSVGAASATGGGQTTVLGLPLWAVGALGAVALAAAGAVTVIATGAGDDDEPSPAVSSDQGSSDDRPSDEGDASNEPTPADVMAPEGRWRLQIEATRSTADNFYAVAFDDTLRLEGDCAGTVCTGKVGAWDYTWDGATLTFTIPPEVVDGPCADETGKTDPSTHGRLVTTWTPAILTATGTDADGAPNVFSGTGHASATVTELRGCSNGFKGHGDTTPEADLEYTLTRKGS